MKLILDKIDNLNTFVEKSMIKNNIIGLAAAFISNGNLSDIKTYGLNDKEKNIPITNNTHFEAASLTKSVFSYLVYILSKQGKINMDIPLYEYYKENLPTEDKNFLKVTAKHVLSHSTGLKNWGDAPLKMYFEPGTNFKYSGKAYYYLQNILEHITGLRIDVLMNELIFNPLKMDNAALIWTKPLNKTLSRTYDENGNITSLRDNVYHGVGIEPNCAFSLYVTIEDYYKFLINTMSDREFLQFIRSVDNPSFANTSWGLGFGKSREILWHWGDNGEFKSLYAIDPETKDGFVIHTNSFNGLNTCFDIGNYVTDFDFSDVENMINEENKDEENE